MPGPKIFSGDSQSILYQRLNQLAVLAQHNKLGNADLLRKLANDVYGLQGKAKNGFFAEGHNPLREQICNAMNSLAQSGRSIPAVMDNTGSILNNLGKLNRPAQQAEPAYKPGYHRPP